MDLNFEISEGDLDKLNSMTQMRLDWDPNDVI
jgi:hypothetical protein